VRSQQVSISNRFRASIEVLISAAVGSESAAVAATGLELADEHLDSLKPLTYLDFTHCPQESIE